jgi:hypothetical protein
LNIASSARKVRAQIARNHGEQGVAIGVQKEMIAWTHS